MNGKTTAIDVQELFWWNIKMDSCVISFRNFQQNQRITNNPRSFHLYRRPHIYKYGLDAMKPTLFLSV